MWPSIIPKHKRLPFHLFWFYFQLHDKWHHPCRLDISLQIYQKMQGIFLTLIIMAWSCWYEYKVFFWRQTIWGHSTCFCVAFIKTTHWNYNFLCIFKVSRHSIIFSTLSQQSLYVFCLFYYKLDNKLIQLKWGHHMMTENMQNMISVNLGKMILLQSFFRLQM